MSPCEGHFPFFPGQGPSFCVFPCVHSQGGGLSCTTLPRSASPPKLGFCWRSVGWEEGALTQQCPSLYWRWQGDLCYGTACLQGKILPQGPGFLRCHPEARCPGHGQGIPNTLGALQGFPKSPKPTMLGAQSEGQCSSLAAASLGKPALQELTDLNPPEFSPYLFSRQELTQVIP